MSGQGELRDSCTTWGTSACSINLLPGGAGFIWGKGGTGRIKQVYSATPHPAIAAPCEEARGEGVLRVTRYTGWRV